MERPCCCVFVVFFYPCWWRQKDHTGQHGTHIWLVVSKYITYFILFSIYLYIYIYCIYFQPWKWEDDSNLLTISYIYIVYSMYIHSIYTYIYIYYYIILGWWWLEHGFYDFPHRNFILSRSCGEEPSHLSWVRNPWGYPMGRAENLRFMGGLPSGKQPT